MGDVEFDNNETITADSIELNLAMGNFTGGLVLADSFTADVAMGNFDLGVLVGAKTCHVNAGMGNIGLTVDGKADDYTLDLQASMGEVAFNGKALGTSIKDFKKAVKDDEEPAKEDEKKEKTEDKQA